MRLLCHFECPGIPRPQGSKTQGRGKRGKVYMREAVPEVYAWRDAVALAAKVAMRGKEMTGEAVMLQIRFWLPRPKSNKNPFPTGKPDSSKLLRAIEDAMSGIVYVDDAQIVDHEISKRWADGEKPEPGVEVEVWKL